MTSWDLLTHGADMLSAALQDLSAGEGHPLIYAFGLTTVFVSLSVPPFACMYKHLDHHHKQTPPKQTVKGQSGREGTKSKSLRWTPAPAGSTGPAAYYLNATLNDKTEGGEGRKVQASVSLTAPEYRVFKCLVEQCMPLMLGFDLAYTGMVE